jgi:hypothetical protein
VGRSEAKPVAPALQASLATNPRHKSPRPFGLRRGRAPAALRRSTDALRHRSSRRAWPIATPVRNAGGFNLADTALGVERQHLDRIGTSRCSRGGGFPYEQKFSAFLWVSPAPPC